MKIKLVLARMRYNPEIAWTETKTVEVELPINEKGDWEVIGAEWPIEEVLGDVQNVEAQGKYYYKAMLPKKDGDLQCIAKKDAHVRGVVKNTRLISLFLMSCGKRLNLLIRQLVRDCYVVCVLRKRLRIRENLGHTK